MPLIEAAALAPSGDNTQPWRFDVDEESSMLSVYLDETRDTSPMNAGQQMSRLACGAAIENIVQTAIHNGLQVRVNLKDDSLLVATIQVENYNGAELDIPSYVSNRHTNRRPYNGRILSDEEIGVLNELVRGEDEIKLVCITNRKELQDLSRVIGIADALMFGQSKFLRAFLANVRFDLPVNQPATEGLPLGSLEISAFERKFLKASRFFPDRVLKSWLLQRTFRTNAEKLIQSSSGAFLLIPAELKSTRNTMDTQVGQLLQRIWLCLTKAGYQVQPMMSIPVLANAGGADIPSMPASCLSHNTLPAAIIRFGYGSPATARTGRLSR